MNTSDWESIAFDVARNQLGPRLPVEELLPTLGITEADFEDLCNDSLFKRKVKEYAKELTENGTSFALKAQLQAEDLLKTQYKIARDPNTPPSVAVAAIGSVVRWAGFDKRPGDSNDESNPNKQPRISININLGAAKRNDPPAIEGITVDHGD